MIREEYDDNIFLDENDEEDDFITTVRPGIGLIWITNVVDLSLDYGLNFKKYLYNSDQDETSLSQAQRANLDATFKLYREVLFLHVSDVYERVAIDEADKGGLDKDLVNLTDSNRLLVNPYLSIPLTSTVTARLGYTYQNLWYAEEEGDDAEIHSLEAMLSKELTSGIVVSLSGGQTYYRPDDVEEEYDSQRINGAVSWQVTSRLALRGNVGRAWYDYTLEENDDADVDLYGLGGDYQLSESLSIGASFDQDVSVSVNEGEIQSKNYYAYLDYSGRIPMRLSVFRLESDYLTDIREDLARGVSLGGSYPLTGSTGLDYFLIFTKFREDPEQREYERFGGRLGWYYDLRLGRFSVGYTYNENDSNQLDEDYTNNIAWVQMNFAF